MTTGKIYKNMLHWEPQGKRVWFYTPFAFLTLVMS